MENGKENLRINTKRNKKGLNGCLRGTVEDGGKENI
jgi:hypothetical protein